MKTMKTYSWVYLVIFIVYVVVIVGGITVYNKITENFTNETTDKKEWKVLTMSEEGDLVYATVPSITEVTIDPKQLQLDGNLQVTDKIHANKLEIDDTSNFNKKTTFKGELHVENDLENLHSENKFTWGDVEIHDGNIKTGTGKQICIGGSCLTKNLIDKLKNLSTRLDTNSVEANNEICVGGACLNNTHIKMLRGEHDVWITGDGNSGVIAMEGKWSNLNNIQYDKARPGDRNSWRLKSNW
jgi:hypothetical protein